MDKRKNPARTFSIFVASAEDYRVKHGNKVIARFKSDEEATEYLREKIGVTSDAEAA